MNKKWLALLLGICLVGCGGKSASNSYYEKPAAVEDASYAAETSYASGAAAYENNYQYTNEAKEEESTDPSSPVITTEKLVYTGNLTIETLDYAETLKTIRARIQELKGIIEYEYETNNDRSWYRPDYGKGTSYMEMTVRIPTNSFQDFMNNMEGSGKVTNRSTNVENISRQYADNEAVITALRKQEERLLEMMDKAETIEDMIAIEARLTDVQTELNRKLSYKSSMDTDVEYSTVHLYINEVAEYTPDPEIQRRGTFMYRLEKNLKEAWREFQDYLEGLLFGIIHLIPFLLVFVPVILLLVWLWRKLTKDRNIHLPFRKKKNNTEVKNHDTDTE
ncbi:MAG: DUF4349 domain-containing protein [Solobacterium sp.]|nr:DUF4349 domain-containing protein [Solobacterium sp.]